MFRAPQTPVVQSPSFTPQAPLSQDAQVPPLTPPAPHSPSLMTADPLAEPPFPHHSASRCQATAARSRHAPGAVAMAPGRGRAGGAHGGRRGGGAAGAVRLAGQRAALPAAQEHRPRLQRRGWDGGPGGAAGPSPGGATGPCRPGVPGVPGVAGVLGCPPPPAPLLLSSPVLAAEVVKFFFPAMVQLHSYVPASSTPQKLANWGHLNRYRPGGCPAAPVWSPTECPPWFWPGTRPAGTRLRGCLPPCSPGGSFGSCFRKVLSKLNFSIPADMIREVVQCRPGTVEQVLLLLRQKIEEKQKQSKAVPGPGQVSGHPTCLVLLEVPCAAGGRVMRSITRRCWLCSLLQQGPCRGAGQVSGVALGFTGRAELVDSVST